MIETGPDAVPPDLSSSSTPEARGPRRRPFAWTVKRGLDIVVSATSIFLLLPLMLLVAGTISAMDRGSPIDSETRLGSGGRSFQCLRFRTTERGYPASTSEPDDPAALKAPGRLTAFGRVLSVTSLDELPMLLNVLRGEMSLVGPRPIFAAAAADGPDPDAHLSMPPGLTGAWQIEGVPDRTESDRAALDRDYARHWSLRRDFAIMLGGVADAFARRD
ncbi:sugar transferase [Methylobacterium mesophilicum]